MENERYRIIEGLASQQGSPEWHNFRKGRIGASDAASILGISPWETTLQCYERIQFGTKKLPNEAMKRGTNMEAKARDWLNLNHGYNYKPVVIQSIKYPQFIASLDGYEEVNGQPNICEIKCPGIHAHGDALAGRVPAYYMPQLQHQMDLVGVQSMLYLSFDGEVGVIIHVPRDEKYCQELFLQEWAFYASLINFTPPPATDKDWVTVDDSTALEKAERYRQLTLLIDELENERAEIRHLLEPEEGHPRLIVGDMKIQRVIRKGAIDYEKIPELQGKDLEPYRKKPIMQWRFSV